MVHSLDIATINIAKESIFYLKFIRIVCNIALTFNDF